MPDDDNVVNIDDDGLAPTVLTNAECHFLDRRGSP